MTQANLKFFKGCEKEGFTVMAPLKPGKEANYNGDTGSIEGMVVYHAEDDHLAHSLFAVSAIREFLGFAEKTWHATEVTLAIVLGERLSKQMEEDNGS